MKFLVAPRSAAHPRPVLGASRLRAVRPSQIGRSAASGRGLLLAALLFAPACDPAPSGQALSASGSTASPSAQPSNHGAAHDEGPRPPRAATPAETAILAPLAAGGDLAGFQVKRFEWADGGVLDVVCQKGSARIVLTVAAFAQGGPSPPASTDRYAVFYSLRGAEPDDGERAAKALAALLEANKNVPPPPGLGPFVPRPISL